MCMFGKSSNILYSMGHGFHIALLNDQRVYTNTRRCKWMKFNFQTWPGFEARSKSWNMLDSPGQFQSVQASEVGENLTSTTASAVGENLTSTESGCPARHFLRGIKLEEDWCVSSADIWRKTSAFERLALICFLICPHAKRKMLKRDRMCFFD